MPVEVKLRRLVADFRPIARSSRCRRYPDQSAPAFCRSTRGGAHFGCGAGASPEVPGGGTTLGSRAFGVGFSMAGSTSFGWMTPFDWFSSLLRFWAGALDLAPGVASFGAGPVAWANAAPPTRVTPATNRQNREPMIRMLLNALMCGAFPGSGSRRSPRKAIVGLPVRFVTADESVSRAPLCDSRSDLRRSAVPRGPQESDQQQRRSGPLKSDAMEAAQNVDHKQEDRDGDHHGADTRQPRVPFPGASKAGLAAFG
jgi:hypothetical protein